MASSWFSSSSSSSVIVAPKSPPIEVLPASTVAPAVSTCENKVIPLDSKSSESNPQVLQNIIARAHYVKMVASFVPALATAPRVRARGSRSSGRLPNLPPPFDASVTILNQRFRFRATAAVSNSPISTSTLMALCGGQSGGANILYTMASSVRLKSITCYPPVGSSDAINLSWNPAYVGQIKDAVYTTSLPDGITVTTPLRFVPPRRTLLADWFADSVTPANLCNIIAMPEGTIVDVRVDFTLAGGLPPQEITVAGGTLSNVYYPPLDALSKCLNVALPSILY
jgi:hypothetical protein